MKEVDDRNEGKNDRKKMYIISRRNKKGNRKWKRKGETQIVILPFTLNVFVNEKIQVSNVRSTMYIFKTLSDIRPLKEISLDF